MNRRVGPLARGGVGIVVSAGAIFIVAQQVDVGRTLDLLGAALPGWLALMLTCQVVDLLFRARRWQGLVRPIHRVRYPSMLGYLLIGYFANNVLPARLGELVRSHYLGDREGISRTTTLGTVVVERVVDVITVVSIASLSILVLQIRGAVVSAVLVGLAAAVALIVALGVGIAAHRLPGAERARQVVSRWPQLYGLAGRLQGGLAVAAEPRTVAWALLWSGFAWSFTVVAFAAAGQAVGVQLTVAQAALLASGVALAAAVPAGPANLGTFDLAAIKIGESFGIASETALALALVVHAGILATTSLGGSVALLRLGWRRADTTEGSMVAPR